MGAGASKDHGPGGGRAADTAASPTASIASESSEPWIVVCCAGGRRGDAQRLCHSLRERGYSATVQVAAATPRHMANIEHCAVFLGLVDLEFQASAPCRAEFEECISQNRVLIPLLCEQFSIADWLLDNLRTMPILNCTKKTHEQRVQSVVRLLHMNEVLDTDTATTMPRNATEEGVRGSILRIQKHISNETVCSQALVSLLGRCFGETEQLVADNMGGILATLNVMSRHHASMELQLYALAYLCHIVAANEQAAEDAVRVGAVKTVKSTMRTFQLSGHVQAVGCKVLYCLALSEAFLAEGGLDPVAALLTMPNPDPGAAVLACHVLGRLDNRGLLQGPTIPNVRIDAVRTAVQDLNAVAPPQSQLRAATSRAVSILHALTP